MITSLDGRLLPGRWPASEEEVMTAYESAAERLDNDGWIVGRRTMEDFIASAEPCISAGPVPRPDLGFAPGSGAPGSHRIHCRDERRCGGLSMSRAEASFGRRPDLRF